jgi:hypothetical protein
VQRLFGGDMVRVKVGRITHWLNRLTVDSEACDVDLTGDQFGRPPVQIAPVGSLYGEGQIRLRSSLPKETVARAKLLGKKAGVLHE